MVIRQQNGHGRTQRRHRGIAFEDIARLVGPGQWIGGIGKLPQMRGPAGISAIERSLRRRSNRWPYGLRQADGGFSRADVRYSRHHLPGAHDLAWLGQRLHHGAIRICHEGGILALVLGDLQLCLRCVQQGAGAVRRGLCRIVFRGRNGARRQQAAIALFIRCGLNQPRFRGGDIAQLGGNRVLVVGGINSVQRGAGLDHLAGIHQALNDLSADPETQIALNPGGNGSGEGPCSGDAGSTDTSRTSVSAVLGSGSDCSQPPRERSKTAMNVARMRTLPGPRSCWLCGHTTS